MSSKSKSKKATYLLPARLLDDVKAIVRDGSFRSVNAFVEQALAELVQRVRQDQRRQAFAEASSDPLFLADLKAVGGAFEATDEESLTAVR